MHKPIVLVILDGWGVSPRAEGNAILQARKPNLNQYQKSYPYCLIQASGIAVGLTWGQTGNSEAGHLSIGSGRVPYQSLPRISLAIQDGSFYNNKVFTGAIKHVKNNGSTLHLMGLVSNGGVHSYFEHLLALLDLAAKYDTPNVKIHIFTDGRDAGIKDGIHFINRLVNKTEQLKIGQLASVMGRFYAMDRSNNWDRTEKAYNCLVKAVGQNTASVETAILKYYEQNLTDEFIPPTIINGAYASIKNNDAVVFFNFREDRARQLTKAFVLPSLSKFNRGELLSNLYFVTMTEYEKSLPVEVAFPPIDIDQTLGLILSNQGLRQLRIAETEKYAHITYFFSGGKENAYPLEDRVLIPSLSTPSYIQYPEMRAPEITEKIIRKVGQNYYDFILVNYANADMVGHTGDFEATKKAIEIVDALLGNLVENVLAVDGAVIITGDHGNAEEVLNLQSGVIDTDHSINPVPFYLIANEFKKEKTAQEILKFESISVGILADIAPTILELMGIPKPEQMTGMSLLRTIVK